MRPVQPWFGDLAQDFERGNIPLAPHSMGSVRRRSSMGACYAFRSQARSGISAKLGDWDASRVVWIFFDREPMARGTLLRGDVGMPALCD